MRNQPTNKLLLIIICLMAATLLFFVSRSNADGDDVEPEYYAIMTVVVTGKTWTEMDQFKEIVEIAAGHDGFCYFNVISLDTGELDFDEETEPDSEAKNWPSNLLLRPGAE